MQEIPFALAAKHGEEEWSGITNQKVRKKLQNRLNKRLCECVPRQMKEGPWDPPRLDDLNAQKFPARQRKRSRRCAEHVLAPDLPGTASLIPTHTANIEWCAEVTSESPFWDGGTPTFNYCSQDDIAQKRAFLSRFAEQALSSYAMGIPRADHYLRLLQLNIINGFTNNSVALGFSFDWLVCESVSPFGHDSLNSKPGTAQGLSVPPSLAPTKMQLRTKHHPWLDLFPLPRLRDNLLIAVLNMTVEEEEELFGYVIGSGEEKTEWAGLVVWGEPWDPRN